MLRAITIVIAMLVGASCSYVLGQYEVPFWVIFLPCIALAAGFGLGYVRGHAQALKDTV